MRRLHRSHIIALVALASMGAVEAAAPALTFSSSTFPSTISVPYSPSASQSAVGTIRVSNANNYTGAYSIVFTQISLSPIPAAPAQSPSYALYKPGTNPTSLLASNGSPTGPTQVLGGTWTKTTGTSVTMDFAVVLSTLPMPPLGTYSVQMKADLYRTTYLPSGKPDDSKTFTIEVSVAQYLDVSVMPPGGAFSAATTSQSLVFDSMVEGGTQAADLVMRSNVGFSVALSSLNGWALKNAVDASLIPYSVSLNTSPLTLTNGVAATIATGL
ncbi:MAG: hypothetical protein WCL50_12290 [Spirochaetota bacterium]